MNRIETTKYTNGRMTQQNEQRSRSVRHEQNVGMGSSAQRSNTRHFQKYFQVEHQEKVNGMHSIINGNRTVRHEECRECEWYSYKCINEW
jgi:hypothetical protein